MFSFGWFDVRKSSLTDVPQVYKIDSESMVSSFAEDSFINKVTQYGDMFLVATGTGTPGAEPVYGYIVGSPNEVYTRSYRGYVYISRFAVKNKVRRRGIGKALLAVLERYMMSTGKYRGIILDIRASNTASLTFFRNAGYIVSKKRSREEGYGTGKTRMERYKVVMYKKFPVLNG